MLKKYRIELILFAFAVIIRFGYAMALQLHFGSHVFISFSDAATYLRIAHNFLNYHTFSQVTVTPFLLPDPLRTPLYPIFLAVFVYFKTSLLFIVLVQDFLAGLMALMVYKLGVKIFKSQPVGIIASIIFGLEPMSIYWNNLLMSDTLASFLFLFALYLFVSKKYYFSAFVMGMATLTRPTYLYLFPIFLLMLVYEHRDRLLNKASRTVNGFAFWKKVLIIIFIFFFSIFPWMLRNKIQFNSWELSSNGWMALYYLNAEKFASIKNEPYEFPPVPVDPNYHPDIPERKITYYYEFYIVSYYKNYFFNLVSKYPLEYMRFHAVSAIKGFNNHDYDYIINYVLLPEIPNFNATLANLLITLGQKMWYVFYGFLIYGFFVKGKREWQVFFVSFFVANNFLTGYISTGSGAGRYGLPFLPLTLLLVSYGFVCFYKYIKNKLLGRVTAL